MLTKTGNWFSSKETKAIIDSPDGMGTNFRPIPTAEDRRTMRRQGSLNRDPGRGLRRAGRGRPRNETEEERAMRLEEERQNFLRRPSVSDDEMETTPPESPRYYSDDESYRQMNRKKIVTFQDPRMNKGRGGMPGPNGQIPGGQYGRGAPAGRGGQRGGPVQGPRQGPPSQYGPGAPGMKPGYGPNQGQGRGLPQQGYASPQPQLRGQGPHQGMQQGPVTRPGLGPQQGGQYGPRAPGVQQGQRPLMTPQQQGAGLRALGPSTQAPGSPRPGFAPAQQQHGPNFVPHGPPGTGTSPNNQLHGPHFVQHGPSGAGGSPNQQQHGPNFVQHGPPGAGTQPNQHQVPGGYGHAQQPRVAQQQVHGPNFVQHSPRGLAPGQPQQQPLPQGYGPHVGGQGPLQQHGPNFVSHSPQNQLGGPHGVRAGVSPQPGQQVGPGGIRPGLGPQQGQGQVPGAPSARQGQGMGRGSVPVSRSSVVSQSGGPPGSFVGPHNASIAGGQGGRAAPPGSHGGPPVSQAGVAMSQTSGRPGYGPQQGPRSSQGGPHGSPPISQPQPGGPPVSHVATSTPVIKRGGQSNQSIIPTGQPPPLTNAYLGAPHSPPTKMAPVQSQQIDSNKLGPRAQQAPPGRAGTGLGSAGEVRRKGTPPSPQSMDVIPGLRGDRQDLRRKGTPPSQQNAVGQLNNRAGQRNSTSNTPRETVGSSGQNPPNQNVQLNRKTSPAPHEPQPTQIVMETLGPVQRREKKEDTYGSGREQGYRDSFGFEMEDEDLSDSRERTPSAPIPVKVGHS